MGLTQASLGLVEVNDEWLVDLTTITASATQDPDSDTSPDEILEAADRLCIVAFPRSDVEVAGLVEALEHGRIAEGEDRARAWAESERRLGRELQQLLPVEGLPQLEAFVGAVRAEAQAIAGVADQPQKFVKRPPIVLGPVRRVVAVTSENGFAQFACAAPTGRDPAG